MAAMRLRPRLVSLLVGALLAVCGASAQAAPLPPDTTAIVPGQQSLLAPLPPAGPGTGGTFGAAMSGDGRYVAYVASAPAPGLPPGVATGVVVRDTTNGTTVLASRADGPDGAPLAGIPLPTAPRDPVVAIDGDGGRVAFIVQSPDGTQAVWVRDLKANQTILASPGLQAEPTDSGNSLDPSISADGNRVAFISSTPDPSAGDSDHEPDAFVRDLAAGTTTLVSVANTAGVDADAIDVRLSADGQHVAFTANVAGIVSGGTDVESIYERDLTAPPATRLVSVTDHAGASGNASSREPSISADGSRVAFTSDATNLGGAGSPPVPPQASEVWVHDFTDGSTVLASRADGAGVAASDDGAFYERLSDDGHVVAFVSRAGNVFPGLAPGTPEVYRRDLVAGTTQLVSRGPGPNGAPTAIALLGGSVAAGDGPWAISPDGGCIAFTAGGDLLGPSGLSTAVYVRTFRAGCMNPADPPKALPPGSRDTTPPVLRAVSLTRARFGVGKARTAVAAAKPRRKSIPRGTVLRFTSSEAARLSIAIERVRPGRTVKRRAKRVCVVVRRPVRPGRCTLSTRVATLTRTIKAGRGSVALSGRIGAKPLAPGAYRLTLTARDAAGDVSKATRLALTVLAG